MVSRESPHAALSKQDEAFETKSHAPCDKPGSWRTRSRNPIRRTPHAISGPGQREGVSTTPLHSFAGLRPTTFTHSRPPARSLFCGPLDCARATNGFFSFLKSELSRGQGPAGRQKRESDRPPIACFFCGSRPGLPAGGRGSPFFVTALLLSRHPAAPPTPRPARGGTPWRSTTRRFR